MAIIDLLTTNTFRDWFNKTNEIIDKLNSGALVDSIVANGAFTVNGSLRVVNTFFANASLVDLRGNTTITANAVVSSSCNVWNFACGTLLIQPLNGSVVNSAFTVNAVATLLQGFSANANSVLAGTLTQTGNTTQTGTLAVAGGSIVARQVVYGSANAIFTPADLSSPQYDDYGPAGLSDAQLLNLTPDNDAVITGIASPGITGARILYVQNLAAGFNVNFTHANTSSSANNRFDLPGGSDFVLSPGVSIALVWTSALARWRVLAPPVAATPNTFASLTVAGLTTLNGNVIANGTWLNVTHALVVAGNTTLTGNVTMSGYANIASTLQVTGNTTLSGFANVAGKLVVAGLSTLTGNATLSGFANVAGALTVAGLSTLTGNATLSGDCAITGNVTVGLLLSATYPIVNKTAAYVATANDDMITCNGTFTVTAYTAVGNTGRKLTIKNTNTGVVTANTTSGQTIDGATTFPLTQQYQSVTIESDGANWWSI